MLEAISRHQALGLEELHLLLDVPKATLKRILDDLVEVGWVYRRLGDRRYVMLEDYGRAPAVFKRLGLASQDTLDHLFASTGLVSDLVLLSRGHPMIVESSFSRLGRRVGVDRVIGARPCLRLSAAGRALAQSVSEPYLQQAGWSLDFWQDVRWREEHERGLYRRLPGSWEHAFAKPFEIAAMAVPLKKGQRTVAALSLYGDSDAKASEMLSQGGELALRDAAPRIEAILDEWLDESG